LVVDEVVEAVQDDDMLRYIIIGGAWITSEMTMKMEERRIWKNNNTEEGKTKYKKLNHELRRATDKAREDWWEEQCQELENMEKKGRSDLMYSKV
jgi:hypothetical protein